MTEEQLSALLRLKRFEQPPVGYFDRMLNDVHRRQRAELLQRPLWKIAAERMHVYFSEHSMGRLGYAGAMAAVVAVGVGVIGLTTPGEARHDALAENAGTPAAIAANATAATPLGGNRMLVLGPQHQSPIVPANSLPVANQSALSLSPRYVIDARPVSYEPAPSFSF